MILLKDYSIINLFYFWLYFMKKIYLNCDFDVCEISQIISKIMSKWSIFLIDINGPNWIIYDYEMEIRYLFQFQVDFQDIDTRIKLEDLKLNVIHHIESLNDETSYKDNLTNPDFIK